METTVVWDWNGTLLDDVDACVRAMNRMLRRRKMPAIDLAGYRDRFGFPVIDYYRGLGFDLRRERFETLALEYVREYRSASVGVRLQPGAAETLSRLRDLGCRQVILSAMEATALREQVSGQGVLGYFDGIIGSETIHAFGKIPAARGFFGPGGPRGRVLVGDTYHDYEVAASLGCPCVLVRNGHQNLDRFTFDSSVRLAGSLPELDPGGLLGGAA